MSEIPVVSVDNDKFYFKHCMYEFEYSAKYFSINNLFKTKNIY